MEFSATEFDKMNPFLPIANSRKRIITDCDTTYTKAINLQSKRSKNYDIDLVYPAVNPVLWQSFVQKFSAYKRISIALGCTAIEPTKPSETESRNINDKVNFFISGQPNLKMVSYAVAASDSSSVYVINTSDSVSIDFIRALCAKNDTEVIMLDSKLKLKILTKVYNINISSQLRDPIVLDWVTSSEEVSSMFKDLHLECVDPLDNNYSIGLIDHIEYEPNYRAALEARLSWIIYEKYTEKFLKASSVISNLLDIEMSCLKILADSELQGICVDLEYVKALNDLLSHQSLNTEQQAYNLAGKEFLLNSSHQVAEILNLYTVAGRPNTGKYALEKCSNPIAPLIVQWRQINTAIKQTIQPLLRYVKTCVDSNDCGYIYSDYNSLGVNGRISMRNPDIQNISRKFDIHDAITNEFIEVNCRKAIKARKGYTLLSVDYRHLELRIIAHLSNDPVLKSFFKEDSARDIFRTIASFRFKIPEQDVTETMRYDTKQLTYGIIYDRGGNRTTDLAFRFNITEEEANEFIRDFKNIFPELKLFVADTIRSCQECGYIETLEGRRRYLPDILSNNEVCRVKAERKAVNYKVQGIASEIVKKGMNLIRENIKEPHNLVLNLHDQLIYEFPSSVIGACAIRVKSLMEAAQDLSVPLLVKVEVGSSWGTLMEQAHSDNIIPIC